MLSHALVSFATELPLYDASQVRSKIYFISPNCALPLKQSERVVINIFNLLCATALFTEEVLKSELGDTKGTQHFWKHVLNRQT